MLRLSVESRSVAQFIDITPLVRQAVEGSGTSAAACIVFSPHTTAGITINEHADPAVAEDMIEALHQLVPNEHRWRHLEGNTPAHVRASLLGTSVTVPIEEGELALGTWQGIFFCEFDGPRTRQVWIRFLR